MALASSDILLQILLDNCVLLPEHLCRQVRHVVDRRALIRHLCFTILHDTGLQEVGTSRGLAPHERACQLSSGRLRQYHNWCPRPRA